MTDAPASQPFRSRTVSALAVLFLVACTSLSPDAGTDGSATPEGLNVTDATESSAAVTIAPTAVPAASVPAPATFDPEVTVGVRTETDIPMTELTNCGRGTCTVPLDVVFPEAGQGHPTVVLVAGGPGDFSRRRYLAPLAASLARRDLVVFLPAYRSHVTGDPEVDTFHDLRCAVRYAREHTSEYGGDPARVTLVGHSYGSIEGLQFAIRPDEDAEACLAEGSGIPDAVVGLAGFGVRLRDMVDSPPPIWLISGSDDEFFKGMGPVEVKKLEGRGGEASYLELAGIDHSEIVDPDAAPEVVETILEVTRSGER